MSKHDTLVRLIENSILEPIIDLFPDGLIPMRDPFSMKTGKDENGKNCALWVVDMERLDEEQTMCFAEVVAYHNNTDLEQVMEMVDSEGGFLFNGENVVAMYGDAENYARTLELADFLEAHPKPDPEAFEQFCQQQYRDWIDGNKIPDPMPENYEDVDDRFKTPELEQAYKERAIEKFLEQGNYRVFELLTGRPMVDALNALDPDNQWELVNDCIDDDLES